MLKEAGTIDLQKAFLNPRIHSILHKLTAGADIAAVHEHKFRVEKDQNIKLLSDVELQAVSFEMACSLPLRYNHMQKF